MKKSKVTQKELDQLDDLIDPPSRKQRRIRKLLNEISKRIKIKKIND